MRSYSRHSFLWPTYVRKLKEVIFGLEAAWAFFGSIPKYVVIDNFLPRYPRLTPCVPSSLTAPWDIPSAVGPT